MFICATTYASAQKLDNSILQDVNKVGVATAEKDTLYLIDCNAGHNIKKCWDEITSKQLEEDGIEKTPVFVMVDSINEFKSIYRRILNNKESDELKTNLY